MARFGIFAQAIVGQNHKKTVFGVKSVKLMKKNFHHHLMTNFGLLSRLKFVLRTIQF